MSAQEDKEKARRLYEEAVVGKKEVIDEVLDPNFVCYDPNAEGGGWRNQARVRR